MRGDYYRGKTALVTGAASGIGRALCRELAARGAKVIAGDVDVPGVRRTASAITAGGGWAKAVALDVTSQRSVRAAVSRAVADHGGLDFCFNVAAICITGDLRDLSADECCRVLEVNLHGIVRCSLAAYAVMANRGSGHIVNVSSMAGFAPFSINTPYTASKYGAVGFTEAMRYEARGMGVRVSLVCPGVVRTPFYDNAEIRNVERRLYVAGLPERMMTPEKAARAILRGVARNRSVIVFPLHAKLLRIAARIPGVMALVNGIMVRKYRLLRRPGRQGPGGITA
ncbi:MAG: SDR family oxidoreductase [Spirochaetes bacterium]|nr:SDR family oxidoreductase [Spirochaetota bacterium]